MVGFSEFKFTAKRRGIEFKLTPEYLFKLYTAQNGLCALSGEELILPANSKDKRKGNVSLDRINSDKGYIPGNVQLVHKTVNLMKQRMSNEELREWCKKIHLAS